MLLIKNTFQVGKTSLVLIFELLFGVLIALAIVYGFLTIGFLKTFSAQDETGTAIRGEVVPGSVEQFVVHSLMRTGCVATQFVEFRIKGLREPIRAYFQKDNEFDLKLLSGHVFIKLSNSEEMTLADDNNKLIKYRRILKLSRAVG